MNQKHKNLYLFLLSSILLSFLSCHHNPEAINVSFHNFGPNGMMPDEEYIFSPFENLDYDSLIISKYDISLIIRYSDKCRIKQLPLKIESSSFNFDTIYNSEISAILFDDKNKNSGKGGLGSYETIIPFRDNESFDKGLSLAISTPEKNAQGIIALGVICNPVPIDFNNK